MDENKSRDIFYGVIAIATLIVALIGATLAYFSISASSNEGAVNAKAAVVSIEYSDGQEMIAQADELIPAKLEVVQKVYEASIDNINGQDTPLGEGESRKNVCIDSNEKQVCSIYRFKVRSDLEKNITATLLSENNEFTYLSYAVRDAKCNQTNEDDFSCWLNLDTSGKKSKAISFCDTDESNPDTRCYSTNGNGVKSYEVKAKNSIFGLNESNAFVQKTIDNQNEQVYDVVLFIEELEIPQDIDQGKKFQGTIQVNVVGGNDTITGYYG